MTTRAESTRPMSAQRRSHAREVLLTEAMQRLAQGVASLRAGPGWQAWLDTAAHFHNYSINNQLLILMQNPHATMVAGYRTWEQLERSVNKGERSLRILAPTTRTIDNLDETGTAHLNATGETIRRKTLTGFKAVPVFDISQTSGADIPIPPQPVLLTGAAPPGMWDQLAGQVTSNGYALHRAANTVALDGANGVTHFTRKTVHIRADVSDAQAVKTLAHELGHVLLHAPIDGGMPSGCRGTAEVEAESIAYLVAAHAGLDTSDYTFAYVAGWATSAKDDALLATANRIRTTAGAIIEKLTDSEPSTTTSTTEPPALTWMRSKVSSTLNPPQIPNSVLGTVLSI